MCGVEGGEDRAAALSSTVTKISERGIQAEGRTKRELGDPHRLNSEDCRGTVGPEFPSESLGTAVRAGTGAAPLREGKGPLASWAKNPRCGLGKGLTPRGGGGRALGVTSCKQAVFDCNHLGEGLVFSKVWRPSWWVLQRSGNPREPAKVKLAPLTFFQQPQFLSHWKTWSLIFHRLGRWK